MSDHVSTVQLGESERALPVDRKLEEAERAYREARAHRKEMQIHRRKQQQAMQRFDLFKADLEAMGIRVIIEPATHPVRIDHSPTRSHMPKGGNSDDRSSV